MKKINTKQCTNDIITTGRIVFELGLTGSHSGNISCNSHGTIFITSTGSKLGWLDEKTVVSFDMKNDKPHPKSSGEYLTHLEIYFPEGSEGAFAWDIRFIDRACGKEERDRIY